MLLLLPRPYIQQEIQYTKDDQSKNAEKGRGHRYHIMYYGSTQKKMTNHHFPPPTTPTFFFFFDIYTIIDNTEAVHGTRGLSVMRHACGHKKIGRSFFSPSSSRVYRELTGRLSWQSTTISYNIFDSNDKNSCTHSVSFLMHLYQYMFLFYLRFNRLGVGIIKSPASFQCLDTYTRIPLCRHILSMAAKIALHVYMNTK